MTRVAPQAGESVLDCSLRARSCHKKSISTDQIIFLFKFLCFSFNEVPTGDIPVLDPLKTLFSSHVIPSSWSSEKWWILGEETKDSSVGPGKNSKTFLGTDGSRAARPCFREEMLLTHTKWTLFLKKWWAVPQNEENRSRRVPGYSSPLPVPNKMSILNSVQIQQTVEKKCQSF